MIEVVVYPAGGAPGNFVAEVAGVILVKSSKIPLLAAARAVLTQRTECWAETITMRHRGADDWSIKTTVRTAANLAVEDGASGRPCFCRWRSFKGLAA